MLYKEFEKNREDILENEFCMQSNASTLPITDCPSYTPICTIGICIQGNAKIRMDSQEYTIHPHDVFVFMPGLLVSVIETSPHFTTNYFTLSNTFFYDVIKTIRSFSPQFFSYMKSRFLSCGHLLFLDLPHLPHLSRPSLSFLTQFFVPQITSLLVFSS